MDQIQAEYLAGARQALEWNADAAKRLIGRPIKRILLLHISRLGAVMSGRLVAAYERLGVRCVSLDEALADNVYDDEPHQWEVTTGNLLAQMSAVRHVDIPRLPTSHVAALNCICR